MSGYTKKMRDALLYPEMFAAAAPTCPKCTKPMTPRIAKRAGDEVYKFWGCVAFPACLGTRPLR